MSKPSLPPAAPSMVEEWEAERGPAFLARFDRLTGKGHPPRRAAVRLGTSLPCVRALAATVQGY